MTESRNGTDPEAALGERLEALDAEVEQERLSQRLAAVERERRQIEAAFQQLQAAVTAFTELQTEALSTLPAASRADSQALWLREWAESKPPESGSTSPVSVRLPRRLRGKLEARAAEEGVPLETLCLAVLASFAGFSAQQQSAS